MYSGQMNEGTIFPATDFNPGVDAEVLASALQGMECNKDDLIEILTQRSNAQRLIIAQIYNDSYGQDLVTDLKEKLSNHFQEVIVGLMYPLAFFDAYQLRNAMKGIGTDENCLIEILASRTNDEINAINEVYLMQFDVPIQFDVESETSGHFRDALVILTQGAREEGYEYEDQEMATQDATYLWEACQGNTAEDRNKLQEFLCRKSYQQLWLVFNNSNSYLTKILNKQSPSAVKEIFRNYLLQLDLGFHNKTIIRILISRSELDLMNIKRNYKERYGNSLNQDIRQNASGHYEAALLAISTGDAEDY
ncbi:annexin A10-like isoform X2 [Scyliorhinus canicula]|uniref:annexin A10-like isoform X2 n=1 Tax=Scyliorhinus canicula TaxID=7830 RepID=UPI0018F700BF|nr:annexin A10-like isoform X2 [Scyliorhinus canicula]